MDLVQVPLTPALRAAKAAREQALQRAPLTRRSEAILYQVCLDLFSGWPQRS